VWDGVVGRGGRGKGDGVEGGSLGKGVWVGVFGRGGRGMWDGVEGG
jgi:hypothetical protein